MGEKEAKVLVEFVQESVERGSVTKEDLIRVESGLRGEINRVETELGEEIGRVEVELGERVDGVEKGALRNF